MLNSKWEYHSKIFGADGGIHSKKGAQLHHARKLQINDISAQLSQILVFGTNKNSMQFTCDYTLLMY